MALRYNCPICNMEIGYEGLCWKCKAQKEKEEAERLTNEEIAQMQKYLVEHIQELGKLDNPAYKQFWDCLAYHGVISEQLQYTAAKERIFRLPELYYGASDEVRDMLIEYLKETEDSREASRLLTCLAIQGDEKVQELMYELKRNPKPWRQGLYVDSDIYAQAGGWTFDENGVRQEINYPKCYSMEKKQTGDEAVKIGRRRKDNCPHCNGKLVDILAVNGRDKRLEFLETEGTITATCCPSCVIYTDAAFSRYELNGESNPVFPYEGVEAFTGFIKEKNNTYECEMNEEEYAALAFNGLELEEKERPLFFGADDWNAVTIGGFAHWIQDWSITTCPDCGKPMRYLAQLSWETIMDDAMEGTLYIEICPECRIASMQHQQT